jgi:hypothetical protein
MADVNKFLRSKDRITEILNYLMSNTPENERTHSFINNLEKSIKIIDDKMEEFKTKELIKN